LFFFHHGQFFRPLNLIIVSILTVRRHDATPPSSSATVLATLRAHGLTLSSSVLSTPNTQMVKRPLQPRSSHKSGSLVPGSGTSLMSVRARHSHRSCSFQLDFGHPATRASLPSIPFLAKQAVLPSSSTTSRRSSEVDRKDSSQASTHDSVSGRVRVFSLNVDRDVSLYHRRNLSDITYSCAPSSAASS
jgi:hypothetical protein